MKLVDMGGMKKMNNLTYDNLKNIWDGEKNLTNKPIFIDFYGDW